MRILAKTETKREDKDGMSMSGCELYRQYMPFEHFRQTHPSLEIAYTDDLAHPELDLSEWDMFHFIRKDINLDKDGTWLQAGNIQRAKDAGLPIVMDIDDLWRLDTNHALYELYKRNKVDKLTEGWLRAADLVTTTTERLAEYISKVNPNVHVVPNTIHPLYHQYAWSEPDKSTSDKVRVGWIGGVHHLKDIRHIEEFFKLFWRDKLSDVATISMGGYNSKDPILRVIHAIMAGGCEKGFKNTQVMDALTAFEFATMYKHIDIAIVPLKNNAFNKCKSELKLVEAGWFGIPVIAQDIYPYNTVIEHGYNGYLVGEHESGKVWMKYVKELVEDDVLRYSMGQNLKATIRERFDMVKANETRYKLYSGLTGKP